MSPRMILFSCLMRSVVLIFFIIFLLLSSSGWVSYLFAGVCAVFLAVTLWQLWTSREQ